ncbi:oxygen-evolving enhancer protein 3, chloroplastic [Dunaliella salina]|uniref:Oxygen-evolving enhancer protein 3, chloroplastic n=1 Tax=Dunaliella salina TaxID=3046 RepID=A0ABQ7GE42_DUNSA|nr:oxygen-evolving enhancer protein 3, chloroplastic [Dunaliella salina]|eukprot:KAF5832886.1 oxygen-evolving enhancer protein 3, chloroplastic [Dunaliella salina]
MQTIANKTSVRAPVAAAARPSRASRVVVHASADRRAVLSGFMAGAAALSLSPQAQALNDIDLKDFRDQRQKGFDIIYEARDLDLDQDTRDGLSQARKDLNLTKERVKESEKRIDENMEFLIKKNYWPTARNELRTQVGTLRFDLTALAETKPKEEKKKAFAAKKDFFAKVEDLDFQLRVKNEPKAMERLNVLKSSLDELLSQILV